jgi:hypothetical protein
LNKTGRRTSHHDRWGRVVEERDCGLPGNREGPRRGCRGIAPAGPRLVEEHSPRPNETRFNAMGCDVFLVSYRTGTDPRRQRKESGQAGRSNPHRSEEFRLPIVAIGPIFASGGAASEPSAAPSPVALGHEVDRHECTRLPQTGSENGEILRSDRKG